MTTIVTRSGKGSPLTHVEVDTNFTNLNTAKLEAGAIALGSAATPSISFTGDTNTGIYSPGADQVAVATNGTQRLTVDTAATTSTLPVVHPLGAVGTPSITFTGDLNTGIYSPTADTLAFVEGGAEAMRIDSGGSLVIGTSQNPTTGGFSRSVICFKQFSDPNSGFAGIHIEASGDQSVLGIGYNGTTNAFEFDTSYRGTGARRAITFKTTGAECARIDTSGNFGIGTTTPDALLTVNGIGAFGDGAVGTPSIANTGDLNTGFWFPAADTIAASTGGSERARIDSSGRLLVGTSTGRSVAGSTQALTQVETTNYVAYSAVNNTNDPGGSALMFGKSRGTAVGSNTIVQNGDDLGSIFFAGADGTDLQTIGASIVATVDGTPGANDLPTRLVFSTTADGSASPTERMRISQAGNVGIGGATDPASLLHLAGGGTGTRGALRISDAGGANYWEIGRDNSISGDFTINLLGSEKARIDTSGRLLVGVIASPAHQLQVSTDSAGKPSTNTWTIVSDERIKEEIELADLDLCYQAVKNIPLKRFKWKDEVYTEEQVRDRRKLGWIAQDVEAVFPKAVGTYEFKYNQVFEETIIPAVEEVLDDEGNVTTPAQPERIEKGELIGEDVIEDCRDLNSDQLYAAMYGAIQKLMLKVETLETEVAALKAP